MSHRIIVAVVIASVLCGVPACALVIAGNTTPAPAQVTLVPCPTHAGFACTVSAPALAHLQNGRNAAFEAAWNTALPGEWNPDVWVLNWSTEAIDAVLNATTYRVFAHESGATDSGVELRIMWTPTAEQTDLRWIQALHTNRPRSGQAYYLDIATYTAAKPPLYLYQYPDQRFYDKPTRNCEAGQSIFWNAYLYLARVDSLNKTATIYEGVQWGFGIDSVPVPEPSSLGAIAIGLFGALLTARRSRRRL